MESTILTPASFAAMVREMPLADSIKERYIREAEQGIRVATLYVHRNGQKYLSMSYEPKGDPSPLPQLDD